MAGVLVTLLGDGLEPPLQLPWFRWGARRRGSEVTSHSVTEQRPAVSSVPGDPCDAQSLFVLCFGSLLWGWLWVCFAAPRDTLALYFVLIRPLQGVPFLFCCPGDEVVSGLQPYPPLSRSPQVS